MIKVPDRAVDLLLYSVSAAFALITALTSTLMPHRAWGAVAAWGYLAAALLVYAVRRRDLLTWGAWAAVALLPLVVQSVQRAGGRTDRAQEEVLVVEHMGESLLHTGTPYLGRAEIAAIPLDERLLGYRPYQPGMSVFGLPRALMGDHWWTDARIWFAIITVAAVGAAVALLRSSQNPSLVRATQAATVLPVTALTLATGGDDIPVLALCLLALALSATGRPGWSGVAVGAAAACKLFALPVVAVLVVLAVATGTWRRLLPGALGLPLLALVPPLLADADALVENVLRFPLGHGLVTSPAQSPFPGYLISQSLPGGRYVAMGLLVTAAAVIGLWLLRRPPRTAATAALFCGYGLLAAILLMPTTRFGYLLYPAALLLWAPALAALATARPSARTAGPDVRTPDPGVNP
ncbi:glycosyltransferase 87 family protein [Actinoplanes sp. NEAU-A12]|uniref:Glycosyltransferase 87 family protein n=1 Tax=Actinoplanes sandaracinus TaxID=3045177 RepID=A0ABT6WHA6_9ACTN|nr:glycosyltransferase 87 family protein [Actinoplanes sandaracinus]MDI6099120.1 glycosyltransferase 87 family protein [Actinoplanes sandaracinus]